MQLPLGNQRWREGRASYRRPDEPINTLRYEIAEIFSDNVARAFIEAHHYSGTYPSARRRFGLYHHGELVGLAVFSHPMQEKVLTNEFPTIPAVELGRFVLGDNVPGNGETWMLGRTFELIREQFAGVVSFSDPVPRLSPGGEVVFRGHYGNIYQAHNGVYRGRSSPATLRVFPDGVVLNNRGISKLRQGEVGWRATAQQLEAYGAAPAPAEWDVAACKAWLDLWRERLTRPLRHHGNHRYVWVTHRKHRRELPAARGPYPKTVDPIRRPS